jgi:hypothetical protein
MTQKRAKKPTYAELVRQNMELKGQLAHAYTYASHEVAKASTKHLMASGVLVQLSALGGREIIQPVVIRDGLSDDTIEALKRDLARSFDIATAAKPQR